MGELPTHCSPTAPQPIHNCATSGAMVEHWERLRDLGERRRPVGEQWERF